jgi:hypothetical protein
VTLDEISADKLGNSHSSVQTVIHKDLAKKVCTRWFPREFTAEYKENHVEVCIRLLEQYQKEGETLLKHIVTGDETWVCHSESASKQQSMYWKHLSSPMTKN